MRSYRFVTVDVFTDTRFGGNPLAVFPDAAGLSDAEMLALSREFNLSETTFVLPPADPANTARVRIFNRSHEMAFAGHPNVGTAFVLARSGQDAPALRFEEIAGLVEVDVLRDQTGTILGAEIQAPQPLALADGPSVEQLAACVGLRPAEIVTGTHAPVEASMGTPFVLAEVSGAALGRAGPDLAAFLRVRDAWKPPSNRLAVYLYARAETGLRARMFSPIAGTFEDAATGSAATALAALLLSFGSADRLQVDILQGVEIGRPSHLHLTAFRAGAGIRARVRGHCVPVLQGSVDLAPMTSENRSFSAACGRSRVCQ